MSGTPPIAPHKLLYKIRAGLSVKTRSFVYQTNKKKKVTAMCAEKPSAGPNRRVVVSPSSVLV